MKLTRFISIFIFLFSLCSCNEKRETVSSLIDKGVDHANENKFDEAIQYYSKAIKLNPQIQLSYYDRGIAYTAIKDYPKAFKDFNTILNLKTTNDVIIEYKLEDRGQVDY